MRSDALKTRLGFRFTVIISDLILIQGRLNSVKVVGAQLANKIHFYCEKLNFYEHLQILPPVPPWFRRLCNNITEVRTRLYAY